MNTAMNLTFTIKGVKHCVLECLTMSHCSLKYVTLLLAHQVMYKHSCDYYRDESLWLGMFDNVIATCNWWCMYTFMNTLHSRERIDRLSHNQST